MTNNTIFMKRFGINNEYSDFFTENRVATVENNLNKIREKLFFPKEKNIFLALSSPISELKVVILGQDPYFQYGAATGLAFEVGTLTSFTLPFPQKSLQNIIRVIYSSYQYKLKTFSEIRDNILSSDFIILPPNKLFKSWKKQGVLLLNSYLTVESSNGSNTGTTHKEFWEEFSKELITYISNRNKNLIYFLWGAHAQKYEKFIFSGITYKCNHPAMAFGKTEKDFLFFQGFEKTKNLIDWCGL
jgi:uracil-DNA glycosylase